MLEIKGVDCMHRENAPKEGEDFSTDFEITPSLLSAIKQVSIYFRSAEECPLRRDNWIIDIELKNEQILCVKLPKEMALEEVKKYINPLKMALLAPGNKRIH